MAASTSTGKVRFDYVHERNIGSVKKLLQVTLPVEYPDKFYDELVASPQDLTQLGRYQRNFRTMLLLIRAWKHPLPAVFYNEVLVGVVGVRVEPLEGAEPGATADKQLYLAAMAVLPAYRDLGLGA